MKTPPTLFLRRWRSIPDLGLSVQRGLDAASRIKARLLQKDNGISGTFPSRAAKRHLIVTVSVRIPKPRRRFPCLETFFGRRERFSRWRLSGRRRPRPRISSRARPTYPGPRSRTFPFCPTRFSTPHRLSFSSTFDGLPPSGGTILANSGPDLLNVLFNGQVVAESSNRRIILAPASVPEPGSIILLAMGAVSFSCFGWRCRIRANRRFGPTASGCR